jgi:DNA-binding transcriptional regulator LsrR (DeoR family)
MSDKSIRRKMRGNIAWSLRHVHKLTYREVGMSLGISSIRARQLVTSCEASDRQQIIKITCDVYRTNAHIEALGHKFVDEVLALCESLNGVSK